jgi:cyanidin-3-O-glucoside 2''-O-glucuronosyltransferase
MGDSTQRSGIRVLMLPWLAHGHITPFLELGKKLADRNFHIYFCSTPVNLNSLKPKLSDSKYSNSIQIVELHLPSFPELPPHYHTTKGLPPHLMPILEKASNMSRPNITNIIETLKPDLVMYDYHARWVPEVASSLNIAAVSFITTGVAMISFFRHYMSKRDGDDEFPFPEILTDYVRKMFSQIRSAIASSNSNEHKEKGTNEVSDQLHSSSNIMFVKSLREIEGKYMDHYFDSFGVKIVPVGPLVSDHTVQDDEGKEIID